MEIETVKSKTPSFTYEHRLS